MHKKTIVISINTAWNIANFRAGLIRALRDQGHEVIAIAPPDDNVARLVAMGCRFVPLPMDNKGANPVKDLGLLLRYVKILRRERPDVFLGYTIKPNIYGSIAAQLLGIPVINNISGLGTAFIRDTLLTRIVQELYRTALKRSHRVLFQNADDRGLFVERGMVSEKRSGLVPGSGIDLERFAPQPLPGQETDVRFLLIARLLYDKGVGEYVEAARLLKQRGIAASFSLLGFLDAENRTAVPRSEVKRWEDEGTLTYLGSTDDVRPSIAEADCVVLPSYREGTPRTLLESAAMARPLITTDVPGCREAVDHGNNGFLCQVRDPQDLADKMQAMVALGPKGREAMGMRGRAKMERQFAEELVISEYLRAIRNT